VAATYDVTDYPLICEVHRNSEAIIDEFRNLDKTVLDLPRMGPGEGFLERLKATGKNGWTPSWQVGSDEPNYAWMSYLITDHGWYPAEVATKLPRTLSLLSHPAFEFSGFSLTRPLSVIGQHAHSRRGGDHLSFHLGLDVEPGKCFLRVNEQFIEERYGEIFVFDASQEHFAFNASLRDRTILYVEFDRSKF